MKHARERGVPSKAPPSPQAREYKSRRRSQVLIPQCAGFRICRDQMKIIAHPCDCRPSDIDSAIQRVSRHCRTWRALALSAIRAWTRSVSPRYAKAERRRCRTCTLRFRRESSIGHTTRSADRRPMREQAHCARRYSHQPVRPVSSRSGKPFLVHAEELEQFPAPLQLSNIHQQCSRSRGGVSYKA